jgi:GAF domain-containing protein
MPGPDVELAETFAEIARSLFAEPDAAATLDSIVKLAVEHIDGCEHAGISMIFKGVVSSPASSDEVPATVDRIQAETGEGPCVDAIREHEVFQTGQLSQEERWPEFTRRTRAESDIESILSLRLFAEQDTIGALNLYSSKSDAFDARDVAVGTIFATHAAVAMSNSRKRENLEAALLSRQLIGQAIGLLRARDNISEKAAFDMLKRASQRLNVKLSKVADRLVNPSDEVLQETDEVPHEIGS